MKNMMMAWIGACLFWASAAQAATVHYEWQETPRPPAPRGVQRWVTVARIDVDLAAVAGGTLYAGDVLYSVVRLSPTSAMWVSAGQLAVDPITLQPGAGVLMTVGSNPYYRSGAITPWRIASDNPLGGASVGHWVVTVTP